jgi:predicted DNA-binding WGR domain protein
MSVSTTSAPPTSATRRFEFVGGNSAKFWQVTVAGCGVTVRFGRLGTDGQVQTKEFPSDEAASVHAERVIAQKAAKGYQEVSAV